MTATTIGAGQTSSGLILNDGDTALVFAGATVLATHPAEPGRRHVAHPDRRGEPQRRPGRRGVGAAQPSPHGPQNRQLMTGSGPGRAPPARTSRAASPLPATDAQDLR